MNLSPKQQGVAINCARTAARTYDECADVMRTSAGHARLAEQFETQAREARELANIIEEAGDPE